MTTVAFPKVYETLQLALYEVMVPFFDGTEHTLALVPIRFFSARFAPNIQTLESATGAPYVAIVGSRVSSGNRPNIMNCRDPFLLQNTGRVRRERLQRTIYVKLEKQLILTDPEDGEEYRASLQHAARIWDQCHAVISTQHSLFGPKGILNPSMDLIPEELTNEKEFVLGGTFACDIEVSYAKQPAP